MVKQLYQSALYLILGSFGVFFLMFPVSPVQADGSTTSITVTKYDSDNVTVLAQETITWEEMRDTLPVYGDGETHYYFQGPTFDDSTFDLRWDPGETVNIDSRDYGASMGTDVKDLCDLVGGASPGDVIKVKSFDGFHKRFDYEDIYIPEPEQGKLIVTWYTKDAQETGDGTVAEDYSTGMRLIFFAETLNPEGKHVFGIWDMHETLAEPRWHYYYDGTKHWPSSSGLSVKWVSDIQIYTAPQVSEVTLTVSVNGKGTTTPAEGVYSCVPGTVVDITAVPDSGWHFVNWSGNVLDPDSEETSVALNGNITIAANFASNIEKETIGEPDSTITPEPETGTEAEITAETEVNADTEEEKDGISWYMIPVIAAVIITVITVVYLTVIKSKRA